MQGLPEHLCDLDADGKGEGGRWIHNLDEQSKEGKPWTE